MIRKIIKRIKISLFVIAIIMLLGFNLYAQVMNPTLNNMGLMITYWKEYLLGFISVVILGIISIRDFN